MKPWAREAAFEDKRLQIAVALALVSGSTYTGLEIPQRDAIIDAAGVAVKAARRAIEDGVPEKTREERLLTALEAALEWIDAVPADIVLPAMPGFDRDDVDGLIAEVKAQ